MSRKNRSEKQRNSPQRRVSQGAGREFGIPRDWILWLILGVTFFAFSNSLFNGFAYDDTTQVLSNQFIRDLKNLPKALVTETWYWRVQQDQDPNQQDKPSTPYYRPVFVIYLMVMWNLFGAWAPGWHIFNVILHMLAVYIVFRMLERVTSDLRLAATASVLFAVHPMRSESVAWVSGLTDPLLAVFLIASFYFYVRYREDGQSRLLAASLALFLLAAFTKEPGVALPIFIAAYELFVVNQDKTIRRRIKPAIIYGAAFSVISAFYFAARYFALGFALNNADFKSYPIYQVALTIPLVIWKYIGLLVWPVDLSIFHQTNIIGSPTDIRFILPFVGLIVLGLALWPLRKNLVARFAVLWFAINLLPVLNLSAFIEEFLVQERYVYVSSVGFSLLVAMAVAKIPIEKWLPVKSRTVAQTALVGALVLVLAGKSLAQNAVWKDDMTLWWHGAEAAYEQSMSHYVLGHKLIDLRDYRKAAEQLEECLKLSPNNLIVMMNLASANVLIYQYDATVSPGAADRVHLDRALELCEKGLTTGSDFAPFWDTLGQVYTFETGLKNLDRAIACFQRGLSLNPENPLINYHLGGTLAKKGDLENGMRYLQIALEKDSGIIDAHKFLGYVYKAKGQLKEAIDELSTYLKLQPSATDASKIGRDLQDLRAQLQALSPQS